MQRTNKLRLEKPDAGDIYNSSSLTNNVNAIGKFLANYGGSVAAADIPIANVLQIREDDWTMTGGLFRVHGNGEASLYLDLRNKKEMSISTTGEITVSNTVADVFPEYETAIAQPLSSGNGGAAFGGYIAPNNTRIVLRMGFGKYSGGTIPINTQVTLLGTYPLANIPAGIGLEQMPAKTFDTEVHDRNLVKIDNVAAKLDMNKAYKSWGLAEYTEVFTASAGITVTSFAYRELIQNQAELFIEVNVAGGVAGNFNGDIANFTLGQMNAGFIPNFPVAIFTTSTGPVFKGYISTAGTVWICSMVGGSVAVSATEDIRLAGMWVKD